MRYRDRALGVARWCRGKGFVFESKRLYPALLRNALVAATSRWSMRHKPECNEWAEQRRDILVKTGVVVVDKHNV